MTHKGKSWKKISEYFNDRTDVQCLHRWQKVRGEIVELFLGLHPVCIDFWCISE